MTQQTFRQTIFLCFSVFKTYILSTHICIGLHKYKLLKKGHNCYVLCIQYISQLRRRVSAIVAQHKEHCIAVMRMQIYVSMSAVLEVFKSSVTGT